ncbi:MAG: hypothetical protein IJ555_11165 [Ruminococcus sp.]|nr:hypothetical protein [Ruminococcus sp.]
MRVDGRLNFDTKIDTRGFRKGLGDLSGQMSALMGLAAKLAGAIGAAFSVKQMISAAAAMKAVESQFEQTFGALKTQAQEAIEAVADSSGILEKRLQSTATSIYAFAKTSGMDSEQALEMMSEALQVAADSAAYYDRSLEETSETLKSFLKGNYANDAALGLSVTETTRNAKAMELYGKKFAELSEAQKQLTLLQMVKDANKLSGAEGQAAREAEGWENVTGNLKQAWTELMAAVGQPMLSLAVPVVKSLTVAVSQLASAARSASSALSAVFGIDIETAAQTAQLSDSAADASDSYSEMAAAAEAASEANENSLAAFDQMNKLSSTSSSGTASSADSSTSGPSAAVIEVQDNTDDIEKRFEVLFMSIKEGFNDVFKPIRSAWEKDGAGVLDSIRNRFIGIYELGDAIGSSLSEVWGNGTGEETVGHLLGLFTDINNTVGNITSQLAAAWNEDDLGTEIVQDAANILNTVLDHLETITGMISDWTEDIDFKPLLTSLDDLEKALDPFADTVGEGLEWLFENVLIPMADWTITKLIPTFLKLLASSIKLLTAVVKKFAPMGRWLWSEFLEPIASWTGGVIISVLDSISDALSGLADVISGKITIQSWVSDLSDLEIVIGSVAAAIGIVIGAGALGGLIAKLGVATAALVKHTAAWISANAPILAVTAAIAAIIAIGALLIKHWDEISAFAVKIWENICDAFSDAADLISDIFTSAYEAICGIFESIGEWFSDRCAEITKAFSDIAGWFGEIFTSAYEAVCSAFSSIGSWFADRYNDVTNAFFSVASFFGDKFSAAWKAVKDAFSLSNVGQFFGSVWGAIQGCFGSITSWFRESFSQAWRAVKDVFSKGGEVFMGITDGILEGFKVVVNALIDGINQVVAIPFDGINWALKKIHDVSILGVKPFTWISTIDVPQIPKLATGTVVPANYGEFLAVLGDNKRETEVVSPLSTIKQAVMEALVELGGTGSGEKISITIPVTLNGKTISRIVIDDINDLIKRTGRSPIKA